MFKSIQRAPSCIAVSPPPSQLNSPAKPIRMNNKMQDPAAFPRTVTVPQTLLHNPTAHGKLSPRCEYELPIDLKQYFNLFISDAAKYSCAEFYREGGDINIVTGNWTQGCVLRAKDEFDFDQAENFARERKITLKCAYGNSYLQVEKYHRYYYYPHDQVLMVRTVSVTKGARLREMFITHERWIIEELEGKRAVHVRSFAGITFPKPPFSLIARQIKHTADGAINRSITRYYKRTTSFVTTVCVARDLQNTHNSMKLAAVDKSRSRKQKSSAKRITPPTTMMMIQSNVIAIVAFLMLLVVMAVGKCIFQK